MMKTYDENIIDLWCYILNTAVDCHPDAMKDKDFHEFALNVALAYPDEFELVMKILGSRGSK
jgi:hypothetical protein